MRRLVRLGRGALGPVAVALASACAALVALALALPAAAAAAPLVGGEFAASVHSDTAVLHGTVNPEGLPTTFHFEYGNADCSLQPNPCASTTAASAGSGLGAEGKSALLSGLTPATTYHYRLVAENQTEVTDGPDRTFTTFPFTTEVNDSCANAHVRQQTGAAALLDCRAYELVSAADTAGYDVESNLIAGQSPFGGYPDATGRVLYGVHDGGIPGTGNPTNRGIDPYVATRGEDGWSTTYVGIPANVNTKSRPFSSTLGEADPGLDTFAFAGEELCAPCATKASEIETGVPLRLPAGGLVQGMAGSVKAESSAKPDGYVAKYFSADGTHFVFGSTSKFTADGNEEGDVSIYDRNLVSGQTHVVSKSSTGEDPPGENLPCLQGAGKCNSTEHDANGIAELDVSANGSHILVAQKVSEDADHNVYYHPYMNVGDSIKTIDLAPGTTHGVLYDGMSEDGSKVFFTSRDELTGDDSDESADVFEAEVSGSTATLTRISSGETGTGKANSCEPVANSNGEHWNTVGVAKDCSALAIGGGSGVATAAGSIYFLSPENLTPACACLSGAPVANQPNLYLASATEAPRFIATLSPEDPTVVDALKASETHKSADFEVTPSGEFAAFPSILSLLPGQETAGHTEIYRYDSASEELACVSCTPTGAPSAGDSSLTTNGLSLSADGRVFFNSTDQLAQADTDNRQDVYEWAAPGTGNCQRESPAFDSAPGACLALISAGTSPFDSGLLSITSDGGDAYFFTRDSLAPQDENGPTMKIYDAREGGGFPYTLPVVPCQASDECHGAGSLAPPPVSVGSAVGTPGNFSAEKHTSRRHKKKHHKRFAKHHRGGKK